MSARHDSTDYISRASVPLRLTLSPRIRASPTRDARAAPHRITVPAAVRAPVNVIRDRKCASSTVRSSAPPVGAPMRAATARKIYTEPAMGDSARSEDDRWTQVSMNKDVPRRAP